jgi:hypothetical protein
MRRHMTDETARTETTSYTAFGESIIEANAGDFADEHDDTSVADDPHGGPEGVEEEEAPRGHSGMD